MATERDLDLLDDYLANKMRGEEKAAFESKIQADPSLQSEMAMQQRLIKAIKDARVAELKGMLNNTPVPPVNYGTSSVMKFAAGTMVAGLIATGIYLYFDKDEQPIAAEEQTTEAVGDSAEGEPLLPSNNDTASGEITENTESTSAEEKVTRKEPTAEPATSPVLDVYDPSAEVETEEPAEERRSPSRAGAPALSVQIDKNNNKYDFHYQFKEGRLMLFGPFEKNLYEILEIFSEEKRTVFLVYNKNYYLLKDDTEDVKKLELITDQTLIRKIKEFQKQK